MVEFGVNFTYSQKHFMKIDLEFIEIRFSYVMLRVMSISLTETNYENRYDISTEKYNRKHHFFKKRY